MTVRLLRLPRPSRESAPPDGDLLTRFVEAADADAFAELVRRHAGMVRGVCRRALGPTADADDAFQAVFLVLVRKARSVSPRSQVGNFLYGVAYRTAAHARTVRARNFARHRDLPDMPAVPVEGVDPDQLAALDDELAKLPDAYRAAVVLCELEGLSLKDAATRLKVPAGTLASRLARGRKLLADRLTRRGLAGLLAAVGGVNVAAAAVPRKLLERAIAGAADTAAAAELAHGVLNAMLLTKLKSLGKVAVGLLFAVGLLAVPVSGQAAPERKPNARRAPVPEAAKLADQKKLDDLWEDLEGHDARATTAAALKMANHPKAVEFLKQKLVADKGEVKKRLADLSGDKPEVWKPVYEQMMVADPLLMFSVRELLDLVPDDVGRSRLVGLWRNEKPDEIKYVSGLVISPAQQPATINGAMSGKVKLEYKEKPAGGFTFTHQFTVREDPTSIIQHRTASVRAVAILEHIASPDAVALLKEVATGHDEVGPTVEAKAALKRLRK